MGRPQDKSKICIANRSNSCYLWGRKGLFLAACVAIVAIISLLAIAMVESASVNHIAQSAGGGASSNTGESTQSGYNNNLEDLINELFGDAGDRLKKSKVNSLRQVKQTLRFGRRSDPMMAPTYEPLSLRELQENQLLADLGY